MTTRKAKAVDRNREFIEQYKKNYKCKFCSEARPQALDFHHKDPEMKRAKVSLLVKDGYSIKTIEAEIAKCEVICANCHRVLHYNINRDRRNEK